MFKQIDQWMRQSYDNALSNITRKRIESEMLDQK